ncbi:MFS transporter [Streptomyces sp. DSM 44915]|uniref:MFS transporter n=1 Tax=Streptomyces chisholmiae TaxID=3075540 RepID=A0ABU2JR56_9ACTN|nr:MFS transporter [Streptomyces sp. DSM 44915]MDT0267447.1 MFS transporter [Streptomyces sp. DSM 44915]
MERRLAAALITLYVATGLSFSVLVVYMLQQQQLSPAVYGLGATVAAVLGLVAGPAIGTLADRFNGCVLYACLMWTMAVATLGLTVAPPLVALGLLSVLVMSARGSAAILAALVGRAVGRDRRLRFRAVVRAMSNVAMIVGLALGAVVLALGTRAAFRASFVVEAVALFVAGFLVWRVRRRVVVAEEETPATADGPGESARGLLRDRRVVVLMALGWLFALAEPMLTIAIPLWVGARMDVPMWIVSVALVVNTLGVVVLQVPVARRVTTVRQAARSAQLGAVFFAIAAVMFPLAAVLSERVGVAAALGAVAVLAVALVVGNILSSVGSTGLLYDIVPQQSYGKSQGLYGMGFDVASLAAPALFGWFAAGGGPTGWYVLGLLFVVSVLPVQWIQLRTRDAKPATSTCDPAKPDVSAAPAA